MNKGLLSYSLYWLSNGVLVDHLDDLTGSRAKLHIQGTLIGFTIRLAKSLRGHSAHDWDAPSASAGVD